MNLHVIRPASITSRRILYCPICQQKRRFVITSYVWYGPTATCCGCGDSWNDGYRSQRPFKPRWRAEAIREAKDQWKTALPRAEADAAFRGLLSEAREG